MGSNTVKNPFVIFIFISIIIFGMYYWSKKNKNLELNGKFTIGKLKDAYPIIGDFNIDYTFKVNYIEFEGTNSADKNDVNKIGNFFIVKFSPNNPNNSKILFDYPVLDTLIIPPSSGWESLPILGRHLRELEEEYKYERNR